MKKIAITLMLVLMTCSAAMAAGPCIQGVVIAPSQWSFDFGDLPLYSITMVSIKITNAGCDPLTITSITSSDDSIFLAPANDSAVIPSQGSRKFTFSCAGDRLGRYNGSFTVNNDSDNASPLVLPATVHIVD